MPSIAGMTITQIPNSIMRNIIAVLLFVISAGFELRLANLLSNG